MKSPQSRRTGTTVSLALLLLVVFASTLPSAPVPTSKPAGFPDWWFTGELIPRNAASANNNSPAWPSNYPVSDDYAAANIGQLKHIASKAAAELNEKLPGGAGTAVNSLISSWNQPPATGITRDDYAAVNLGQLKAVAKPFYDRLIQVGYSDAYPWIGSSTPANDYAAANIGQVKNLFSFDLLSTDAEHDTDHNGLADWWERYYFGQIGINPSALAARGDGLTNLQAFQLGLHPNDYFNGQTPLLSILSGNTQGDLPQQFLAAPLRVKLSHSNGQPFVNAPVTFAVGSGGGQLSTTTNGTGLVSSLIAPTDVNGVAQVFFKLPAAIGLTSITSTTGNGSQALAVTFTASVGDISKLPEPPGSVVEVENPDGSIDLSWADNSDNETEFVIRLKDANGNWEVIGSIPANRTSVHINPDRTLAP